MRRPKGTFTLRTHWGFLVSLYSLGKALYSQSYYLIEIPETGLRDHLLSQAGLLGVEIKGMTHQDLFSLIPIIFKLSV